MALGVPPSCFWTLNCVNMCLPFYIGDCNQMPTNVLMSYYLTAYPFQKHIYAIIQHILTPVDLFSRDRMLLYISTLYCFDRILYSLEWSS